MTSSITENTTDTSDPGVVIAGFDNFLSRLSEDSEYIDRVTSALDIYELRIIFKEYIKNIKKYLIGEAGLLIERISSLSHRVTGGRTRVRIRSPPDKDYINRL